MKDLNIQQSASAMVAVVAISTGCDVMMQAAAATRFIPVMPLSQPPWCFLLWQVFLLKRWPGKTPLHRQIHLGGAPLFTGCKEWLSKMYLMYSTSTIYNKPRWDAQKYSDRLIKIFLVFYMKMRRLVREFTCSISLHWCDEFYIDDILDQFQRH